MKTYTFRKWLLSSEYRNDTNSLEELKTWLKDTLGCDVVLRLYDDFISIKINDDVTVNIHGYYDGSIQVRGNGHGSTHAPTEKDTQPQYRTLVFENVELVVTNLRREIKISITKKE